MMKERKPIFIHSLFRTGSTYLWNKFRQVDRYYCYYEPLHQVMAKLTPENIDFMMTRDFNSVHHPEIEKYYLHEYKSLLKEGQTGIPYFKKEFSYDQFCMNEENPALKRYIDYLVESSGEKIPVLKFNRTAFRGEWFKKNYPGSLNLYLVRNPRDQWQSYHDLYRRTNYDGFFLMDLIIAGLNKDKRDFLPLSGNIPLVCCPHSQQDTENDFYRIVLGIYPDEEKYFIFYYIWFNSFIKNALHSDLIIDINRLSRDPVYNKRVTLFLKEWGIDDIDFSDAGIEEYSSYVLSPKTMAKIEEEVRRISLPSFSEEQIDYFFEKIVPGEWAYFPFKKKYFPRLNKREARRSLGRIRARIENWFDRAQKMKKPGTPAAGNFTKHEKRIDLADQLEANYGRHRSGLKYGLSYLTRLHNPAGTVLDAFIERTFCWRPGGIKPHTKPWIGFIHVPPHAPDWFISHQANEMIFKTEAWKESLPFCKGLFVFSNYHKINLQAKLGVPVNTLVFPTGIPTIKWSWDEFQANKEKKIIQVGWWLRKLHAIFQLPQTGYKKIFLNVEHRYVPFLMQMERDILIKEGTFHDEMYRTAETMRFLPDKDYDRLLGENIVFVYLYDASANNTVTECIARNTPILINPIEPVREYLGADYPFYYNSLEEAAVKAMDLDLIRQTHRYLVDHPIKKKLTGEYFLDSFVDSEIYRSLSKNPRER